MIAFQNKEERLKASYEHSSLVITGLIAFSIILLFVLYLIIQRDIKIKARNRKRLEETIEQNNALLEMRKNIILTISHDIRAKVCQNSHLLFYAQSPDFHKLGLCYNLKILYL